MSRGAVSVPIWNWEWECSMCGADVSAKHINCTYCGAKPTGLDYSPVLIAHDAYVRYLATQAPPASNWTCAGCGKGNFANDAYCHSCGMSQVASDLAVANTVTVTGEVPDLVLINGEPWTPTRDNLITALCKPGRDRTEAEQWWCEGHGFDNEPWSRAEAERRVDVVMGGE